MGSALTRQDSSFGWLRVWDNAWYKGAMRGTKPKSPGQGPIFSRRCGPAIRFRAAHLAAVKTMTNPRA
jgi:hypothetical protein